MEVRATAQGYYDLKIRPEGAEFTIKSEKEFSHVWMEKIGSESKPAAKPSVRRESPSEKHSRAMEKSADKDSKADVI